MKKNHFLLFLLVLMFVQCGQNRDLGPIEVPKPESQKISFDPEKIEVVGDLKSFTVTWETEDVEEATKDYREEADPLVEFLEKYQLLPGDTSLWMRSNDLYDAYFGWVEKTNRKHPLGRNRFYQRLELAGLNRGVRTDAFGSRHRVFYGIQPKEIAENRTLDENPW